MSCRVSSLRFVPVPAPSPAELQGLVQRIAARIGGSLERSGLITRDIEDAYLTFDPGEEAPIDSLLGASITYRIATGPREGQKVFTLQTLPAEPDEPRRAVAESSGFSLHAGIAAKASQRDKLERLARCVSRPPVATERLSLTEGEFVRLALKTPYRDGTTHVMLLRASCPTPFGPAFGCPKSLPAILSSPRTSSPGSSRWCQSLART
jgi:hypothetical protein